jgi:outer membrane receptor for ferrienterochelin and colicins
MGGVVNIITRQLDETAWTGSSTLLAGSQGRMDLSASMMGGRGAVTGLVDVGRRAMDVAPGRPGGDPGAGVTRWDGMAKVGWAAPVDGLRLEASGTLLDERQRWSSGQLNHFADNLQWSGRVGGQLQRGRHNVSSNVYLTAFNHLSRRATSGEPVPGTGDEETQRLAELEVLYNVALGEHAIDAGLEARTEGISSDRVIGADRTFRMLDLFAQGTVQLGELSLVPGVRGTWSDPWGNQFTPRVAAMYRPTESLALRVAAGQGFRAPAFKELFLQFLNTGPGFGYTVRGNPDLRPETSNNLTASLEWTGTTTYLRAQLFNNDFDDFIETRAVTDSANVSIFTYGNVDSGFTRGVEVEAGAAFGGWRIESGLALLEAENGQTGEILLGRPELSARGTLSHARPGGLRVALTGVHTGSTPMRRTEDGVVDWREPFTRFDLRVAQDLPGGLRFVAGVDNVLDQIVAEWPGFVGRQFYTSLSWQTGGARAGGMR